MVARRSVIFTALCSLWIASAAHARTGDSTDEPAVQSVEASSEALLCMSEGRWCNPYTSTQTIVPVDRHSELRTKEQRVGHTTSTVAPRVPALSIEAVEIEGLQPVLLSPASIYCLTDVAWCYVSPANGASVVNSL